MESIDENSVIEDMPFYKDYLSKFDVEKERELKLIIFEKRCGKFATSKELKNH